MERYTINPRGDWQAKVEELGLVYHSLDGRYWDESACYEFTAAEVDMLEAATNGLHRLCVEAVGRVISQNLFARLHIPSDFVPLIRQSWEREDLSLYGRFDLCYDGSRAPKLYEYNADTPTSLLEAAVVQWHWLEEVFPGADQFNSIHEKLIAAWTGAKLRGPVHFACVRDHAEDLANTVYLEDTARQAGLETRRLFMDEIAWNGLNFLDAQNERIGTLFKLYPWEWLLDEQFSVHLLQEPWQVVEPAWKMILSNKAILPLLWEWYPEHPNLLAAYTSPERLGSSFVKKPIFGREGANVTMIDNGNQLTTDGDYGAEGYVYQALAMPRLFSNNYPVIGSWVVQGEAAGMGIRESDSPITRNTSRFVPHYFAASEEAELTDI